VIAHATEFLMWAERIVSPTEKWTRISHVFVQDIYNIYLPTCRMAFVFSGSVKEVV
jgi:hypothetical protein